MHMHSVKEGSQKKRFTKKVLSRDKWSALFQSNIEICMTLRKYLFCGLDYLLCYVTALAKVKILFEKI